MKLFLNRIQIIILTFICAGISIISEAQDKKEIDININKGDGQTQWYMSPVAWIVGGAIFILLLVALLRGRSKD